MADKSDLIDRRVLSHHGYRVAATANGYGTEAKRGRIIMLHTKPERMTLPLTATFLCSPIKDGIKAHALELDIVAVAPTKEQALAKLRAASRLYIEYGIQNRWEDDILFSAPDEYWAELTVDTPISLMEPILIDDRTVRVFAAETSHEPRYAVAAT